MLCDVLKNRGNSIMRCCIRVCAISKYRSIGLGVPIVIWNPLSITKDLHCESQSFAAVAHLYPLMSRPRTYTETWSFMMTSSNGNIFRVTGPLWGESTGDRWIPLTKASDAEFWWFLWSASEQTVEQTIQTPAICIMIRHRAHYAVTVMYCTRLPGSFIKLDIIIFNFFVANDLNQFRRSRDKI